MEAGILNLDGCDLFNAAQFLCVLLEESANLEQLLCLQHEHNGIQVCRNLVSLLPTLIYRQLIHGVFVNDIALIHKTLIHIELCSCLFSMPVFTYEKVILCIR